MSSILCTFCKGSTVVEHRIIIGRRLRKRCRCLRCGARQYVYTDVNKNSGIPPVLSRRSEMESVRDNVVALGSVSVTRGDLLNSQQAVLSLGRVSLPVQKDRYWLAKTMGHVNTAMKRELAAAQKESNRLIAELGEDEVDVDGNKTGQRGIKQTNVAVMQQYADAMEKFNAETVTIANTRKIPLDSLESAGVAMTLSDLSALQWLLQD